MANKQSDPIQILANNIVDTMNSVATRRSDKAPFDKSFNATILGVNRKFTDDVSAEDQTALIAKFSLPETVEDGEKNYYIFKINGAYYCSSQNDDFKLYDKIMVYIPNGDWSNLYIEHFDAYTSGSSGSEISQPNWFVSPDAPGGDEPAEGDLWIMVNNENISDFTNITTDSYIKMYHYGTTDDEQVSKWRLTKTAVSRSSSTVDILNDEYWIELDDDNKTFLKIYQWETDGHTTTFYEIYPNAERGTVPELTISVKPPMNIGDFWIDISSEDKRFIESFNQYVLDTNELRWKMIYQVRNVGEKIPESPGKTAERFNDYRDYTISNSEITGGNCTTGAYDHVEGYGNHGLGGAYNHYEGYENEGNGCQYTHIEGESNKSTGGSYHHIQGTLNECQNGYYNDIGGHNNKAVSSSDVTLRGKDCIASNCNRVLVLSNDVIATNVSDSILAGRGSASGNSIDKSLAFMDGGTVSGSVYRVIAFGDSTVVSDSSNCIVNGNKCEVHGSGNGITVGFKCEQLSTYEGTALGWSCKLQAAGEASAAIGYMCEVNGRNASGAVAIGTHATIDNQNNYQFAVGCERYNSNGFAVDTSGNVYAAGSYGTLGADYAETYEWLDGNPNNDDRRGLIVTLEGKYIRPANPNDDYILGVVSSNPSVCGGTYDLYWHGKYKTDIYGKPLLDDDGKYIISDEYDPEQVYIPQSQRPEKDYVGTNGKLVVIDDGTCIVNKYCKPLINGIGTYSDDKSYFRVIERLDENHIKVVVK